MTVKELREKAKKMGLVGYSKMRKAELEIFIKENTLHNSEILFTGECSGDGEWLEHRKIGATDTSILIIDNAYKNGLTNRPDKYTSPYLMFMGKTGQYEKPVSFTSKMAMDFGHYAEDFIIKYLPELFEKEFGITIQAARKGNQVVGNNKFPLWSCTPDAWVKIEAEWYPVELKTGNSYTAYEWEKEEVPNKYYAQVQQQLAVLGKEKGYLIGFVDNRFTRLYEINKEEKLIELAYELTEKFDYNLKNNIPPALNGCEAECEYLKAEFRGFGNKYEKYPNIDMDKIEIDNYIGLEDTKKEITKEVKEIEKDMKKLVVTVQEKMLELETEELLINGSHLATWKIDTRGAKRFNFKKLKEKDRVEVA